MEVSEDFLNHIEEGVLGVEVWGHRRSGFMDLPLPMGVEAEVEGKRQKSFPEKYVTHNVHVSIYSIVLILVTHVPIFSIVYQ